ncbi:MAG: hypothetical protein ACREHD_05130 [Pirellulales bacterium]
MSIAGGLLPRFDSFYKLFTPRPLLGLSGGDFQESSHQLSLRAELGGKGQTLTVPTTAGTPSQLGRMWSCHARLDPFGIALEVPLPSG